MEPFSIATGSLQIISACAQCTVSLARWIGEVKTVDERIEAFISEIESLSATYNALESSLRSPAMRHAVRSAEESAGGTLWKRVGRSISDCEDTMSILHRLLRNIEGSSNSRLRRPYKQFKESIVSGDIARLRQRIQFFNSTLALPLQMLTVTFQIEQRETSTDYQQRLDARLLSLNQTIERLTRALIRHNRSSRAEASLNIRSEDEKVIYARLGSCLETARRFSSSTSVMSSSGSGMTSIQLNTRPSSMVGIGIASLLGEPLDQERRAMIEEWVSPPDPLTPNNQYPKENPVSSGSTPTTTPASSGSTQPTNPASSGSTPLTSPESSGTTPMTSPDDIASPSSPTLKRDADEFDVELTRRFLEKGKAKMAEKDFLGAEACFIKVLSKLENHDLQNKIAVRLAEAQVMLASSLLEQSRVQEAEKLLLEVTETEHVSDSPSAMTASHNLGSLYLRRGDLDLAESHSMNAVKARGKLLGMQHKLCLQSVELLVKVFEKKGDHIEAEAWQMFIPVRPKPEAGRDSSAPSVEPLSPTKKLDRSRKTFRMPNLQRRTPWALLFHRTPVSPTPQATGRGQSWIRGVPDNSLFSDPDGELPGDHPHLHGYHEVAGDNKYSVTGLAYHRAELETPVYMSELEAPAPSLTFSENYQPRKSSLKSSPLDELRRLLILYADRGIAHRQQVASKIFSMIQALCAEERHEEAAEVTAEYLKIHNREHYRSFETSHDAAIRTNILKGGNRGLAATGHGYSPLHAFAWSPRPEATELGVLIDHGVNVNAKFSTNKGGPRGPTALHLAVERGHLEKVQNLLLVSGIQLEDLDIDGLTPLFKAFRNGHSAIVKLLLEHGARTDHYQNGLTKSSLLHEAASGCDLSLIELLLSRGEPVNWLNFQIRTPLLYALAVSESSFRSRDATVLRKAVRILLDAGADTHVEDVRGYTARDYASQHNYTEVLELLDVHEAQCAPDSRLARPGHFSKAGDVEVGAYNSSEKCDSAKNVTLPKRPVLRIDTSPNSFFGSSETSTTSMLQQRFETPKHPRRTEALSAGASPASTSLPVLASTTHDAPSQEKWDMMASGRWPPLDLDFDFLKEVFGACQTVDTNGTPTDKMIG